MPARHADLGAVDFFEDAYVLCRDDEIEAVGRMRDRGVAAGEVEELDGAGAARCGSSTAAGTYPAFGGDRVDEYSLGGGGRRGRSTRRRWDPRTVRATRALDVDALAAVVAATAVPMLAHCTTTWREVGEG